jgi:hypothetical protein
MSNATLMERPARAIVSAPSAELNTRALNTPCLERDVARLSVRAHAHLRQPSEVSLWALSEAAAEAADSLRAHRHACEAPGGLLADAAREQQEFVAAVDRVWNDHLLMGRLATELIRLACGLHPVSLASAYQKALLIERLVRSHTRRVDELTYEVTLRDFGGQG